METLDGHGVDHLVIPDHNLSHYLAQAGKLFISAVTITSDHKAITGLGTANVVSICHAFKIPVFLFAESMKFSGGSLEDQHIYRKDCRKLGADCEFDMISFSHDYVDLSMVDHIITEKGEINR